MKSGDGAVLPYLSEVTHEVRRMLNNEREREFVIETVRTTLEKESHFERLRTYAQAQARYDIFGDRDHLDLSDEEKLEFAPLIYIEDQKDCKLGWPFPIHHGIDEPPGCYLLVAAINDYAAIREVGFDPRQKLLLWNDRDVTGAGIRFHFWVQGCDRLNANNETTVREVIAAAKAGLWNRREKKLNATASDAEIPDEEINSPPVMRRSKDDGRQLEVSLALCQIRHNGKCFEVSSEAATLVDALLKAEGDYVSANKVVTKPERVIAASTFPVCVRERIERSRKGYRLKIK